MRRQNRDQLELGVSILQHVESQLNRADSKAQFTFSLDTLLIASSAFLGQQMTANAVFNTTVPFLYRLAALFAIAMFVALLISTVYVLLAVIPRLTLKKNAGNNIFYFGNIVQFNKEDFMEDYK